MIFVFYLLREKLAELAEEEFFRAKTAKMLARLMDQKVEKHLLKYSVSVHFKCEDLLARADFCSMKILLYLNNKNIKFRKKRSGPNVIEYMLNMDFKDL